MKLRIIRRALSILLLFPFAGAAEEANRAVIEHGSYIVHSVAMCVQCHSARDENGDLVKSGLLKGAGIPVASPFHYQVWAFQAPPLMGLPTGYTEDGLVTLLTQGKTPRGAIPRRPMPPFRFNEADARAVAAYLVWIGKTGNGEDITFADRAAPDIAVAGLHRPKGSAVTGNIIFILQEGVMHIVGNFAGLTPGLHGLHIIDQREGGEAPTVDGTHLNPAGEAHGSPDAADHHLGDLGNVVADEKGVGFYERYDSRMTFAGTNSILGYTIVVTANYDDLKTQPGGACGDVLGFSLIHRAP